ncbi:MAG: hypothetical protein ACTSR8_12600 [Promethearchaeota archaeon]
MDSTIELIGLLAYLGIFLLVLIVVFIECNEKQRKMFSSLIFLALLVYLIIFIYNPLLQFFFLFLIILDLIFIIYVQILPNFYTSSESVLFYERELEVWDNLKVSETILEEKPIKKKR